MSYGKCMFMALAVFSLYAGIGVADTLHVPADYPTIQAAIDAAETGDTVLVAPGTYKENLDFLGKRISVESGSFHADTVIDGGMVDYVVTFNSGEDVNSILKGFTITNGSNSQNSEGGGIHISNASPTIIDNKICNNMGSSVGYGGGIYCGTGSEAWIENNIITLNDAPSGGGIYCTLSSPTIIGNTLSLNKGKSSAAIHCLEASPLIDNNMIVENTGKTVGAIACLYDSAPTISNNLIAGNTATGNLVDCCGGISCYESSPTIKGNTITGNYGKHGGGILGVFCSETVTIENNTISSNSTFASHMGSGGINFENSSSAIISNNSITYNDGSGINLMCCHPPLRSIGTYSISILDNYIAYNDVRGIYCDLTYAQIENNIIEYHTNDSAGAGIYSFSTKTNVNSIVGNVVFYNHSRLGGGICCYNAKLANNVIYKNTATEEGGGVRYLAKTYDPELGEITGNVVYDNEADIGGGFCLIGENAPVFTNNTIAENTASFGGGIGIQGISMEIINTILWGNDAESGPEIWIHEYQMPADVSISHSTVQGGQSSVLAEGNCSFHWGQGMIVSDPLFVDQEFNDFHLSYNSPCRASGDNTATMENSDFEGDPRIAYGTVDIGADEFYTHFYCTGTFHPGTSVEGKFIGLPGTTPNGLLLGAGLLETPIQLAWGNFYLEAPWLLIPLGMPIPSDGVLVVQDKLPWTPSPPYDIHLQALIGLESNSLTNPFILKVR